MSKELKISKTYSIDIKNRKYDFVRFDVIDIRTSTKDYLEFLVNVDIDVAYFDVSEYIQPNSPDESYGISGEASIVIAIEKKNIVDTDILSIDFDDMDMMGDFYIDSIKINTCKGTSPTTTPIPKDVLENIIKQHPKILFDFDMTIECDIFATIEFEAI